MLEIPLYQSTFPALDLFQKPDKASPENAEHSAMAQGLEVFYGSQNDGGTQPEVEQSDTASFKLNFEYLQHSQGGYVMMLHFSRSLESS